MRTLSRSAAAAVIVLLTLLASAGAAHAMRTGDGAGTPDRLSEPSRHIVVLVGDPTVIPEGREVDEVIVGRGDAIIEGRVDGPVIVANGTAVIRGTVTDSVVVLRGRAIVEDGARVGGDVLSSRSPRVADGATVDGDVQRVRFTAIFSALGTAARVFWWLAVSLSTLVAGLVFAGAFRGMATRTVDAGRTAVAPSIGAGFAATIGLPVISGLLLVTLVGIPLGLTGLFAMAPLLLLGYVAGALFLGSLTVQDRVGPLLSFCLGWLILRIIGLVPFLGGLVTFAATVFGLGALLVAAWRMTRPSDTVGPPAAAPGHGDESSPDNAPDDSPADAPAPDATPAPTT